MAASDFFNRWARRKADSGLPENTDDIPSAGTVPGEQLAGEPAAGPSAATLPGEPAEPPAESPQLPTLEDAALLTAEGNFVPYMAVGVEDSIRRVALKKLFADPQFNIMDGLDIYVGDYSNMEVMPESMLHQLNHARDLLDPLGTLERAAQSAERDRQANLAPERSTGDAAGASEGSQPEATSLPDAPAASDGQESAQSEATNAGPPHAGSPDTPTMPQITDMPATPATDAPRIASDVAKAAGPDAASSRGLHE
jgi:hypothetical protein